MIRLAILLGGCRNGNVKFIDKTVISFEQKVAGQP